MSINDQAIEIPPPFIALYSGSQVSKPLIVSIYEENLYADVSKDIRTEVRNVG